MSSDLNENEPCDGNYLILYSTLNKEEKSHQQITYHVTRSKDKQDNANTFCKGVRAETCTFQPEASNLGSHAGGAACTTYHS